MVRKNPIVITEVLILPVRYNISPGLRHMKYKYKANTHVECGRFPCTVWPQQAYNFTLSHVYTDPFNHCSAAVSLDKIF